RRWRPVPSASRSTRSLARSCSSSSTRAAAPEALVCSTILRLGDRQDACPTNPLHLFLAGAAGAVVGQPSPLTTGRRPVPQNLCFASWLEPQKQLWVSRPG